jgi:hypothetical protein
MRHGLMVNAIWFLEIQMIFCQPFSKRNSTYKNLQTNVKQRSKTK